MWTAVAGGLLALLTSSAVPALAATPAQPTWHAEQAGVPEARSAGRGGEGIVVAVLDSWVDGAHPDLSGRVLPGADCLRGTCTPGPAGADRCDHGTHVSGTVAATSFGVAPRATVLPVRVLAYDPASGECVGQPDDVAAGIRWAITHGARVLNLSLGPDVPGLSRSTAIPAAVDEAAQAGVVVVFSAGNASLPVTDSYDGNALIVAATGPSGALASYSQRGAGVDLAAPGGDPVTPDVCAREDCVLSLFPGDRYSVAAGTSMAAPHVSGVAALLLAQDPTRTREQVVARLLVTARPLADAGRGTLDARAALGVRTATRTRAQLAPRPVAVPPPAAPTAPTTATTATAPTAPTPPTAPIAPTTAAAPPAPTPAGVPPAPVPPASPVASKPAAQVVPPPVPPPVPVVSAAPPAHAGTSPAALSPQVAPAPAPPVALPPAGQRPGPVPAALAALATALVVAAAISYGRRSRRPSS